ncbi:M48 family metalloprotease [Aquirufa sp. OSTEICH-129A]
MASLTFGQTSAETQVRKVFNQLLSFYGSAKSAPQLTIIKNTDKSKSVPAKYLPNPTPKIEIDHQLYTVCQSFGEDSLNAVAIILSHELTHYYNDHLFCSDFAFANLYGKQPNLAKMVRDASLSSIKDKEAEADIKGFFFAAAAGYKPHGVQAPLIHKIYKAYQIADIQQGYPSKEERMSIAKSAENTANELYEKFKSGLLALEKKDYDVAITYFEEANKKIPFRENLNNMGVAKTLKALEMKTITKDEYEFPERFQYPIEIDNKSRLQKNYTRSSVDESKEIKALLLSAQKDFDTSISLDPMYLKSYINLACVYDLLGNHLSAIGLITEKLPQKDQLSNAAKKILAIAYYHEDLEIKAEVIWNELEL